MAMNGISRETLVALHEADGIGWLTINRLWQARHRYPICPGMREGDLRACGLTPKQATVVAACLREERIEARLRQHERAGIEILTRADPNYPRQLEETSDPPFVIYFRGRLELIGRPSIAIVGTRLATAYGRHIAESFSAAFAERGFAVVSGMARGIDTCAHQGALHRLGGTTAVLGMPVDCIYPPENRGLYRQIREQGLLLSEAPPGTPYHSGMFPSRNRIIAGLSLCVVVVEAPIGSGALITADEAIEADRTVFAVPGPITSPRSRGLMERLADGTATMALSADDVMRRFERLLRENAASADRSPPDAEMTDREQAVYGLLLDEPRSVDELAACSGLPLGELNGVLLSLQLKKLAHRLPGSLYGAL